jgi:hypothetical protein
MTLEQAILEKVRALPPEKQQEILEFAESLQVQTQQSSVTPEVNETVEVEQPRSASSLGERLMAIRQQALDNGMQPLTVEEAEREIADRRVRHRDLWVE